MPSELVSWCGLASPWQASTFLLCLHVALQGERDGETALVSLSLPMRTPVLLSKGTALRTSFNLNSLKVLSQNIVNVKGRGNTI